MDSPIAQTKQHLAIIDRILMVVLPNMELGESIAGTCDHITGEQAPFFAIVLVGTSS
jgi:hypothetical protein